MKKQNSMHENENASMKTEYRGLVKNVITNEYEEMYRTEISDFLCKNRTIEKALALIVCTEIASYDVTDVVIEKRNVTSQASEWEVVK